MTRKITPDWLTKHCSGRPEDLPPLEAYNLVLALGELAHYMLVPQVLEKAQWHLRSLTYDHTVEIAPAAASRLAQEEGLCCVILANQNADCWQLIRRGFILPLRWVPGTEHHPHLPPKLIEQATAVLEEVGVYLKQSGTKTTSASSSAPLSYGLQPYPARLLASVDLADMDWDFDSAWASLAAGLLLALWQARTKLTVLASGCSAGPVKNLSAKVQAAVAFGASTLFVPDEQLEEAKRCLTSGQRLEIKPFRGRPDNLRNRLGEFLDELEVPPDATAPRQKRAQYYCRLREDRKASIYYRDCILSEVAEELRQVAAQYSVRPTHLVLTLSYSMLPLLLTYAFRPRKIMSLYDAEIKDPLSMIAGLKEFLEATGIDACVCEARLEGTTWDDLIASYRQHLAWFSQGVSPHEILTDLTAGKKFFSLALFEALPSGSWMLCTESEFDRESRRAKPFTEKFHLRQKR